MITATVTKELSFSYVKLFVFLIFQIEKEHIVLLTFNMIL